MRKLDCTYSIPVKGRHTPWDYNLWSITDKDYSPFEFYLVELNRRKFLYIDTDAYIIGEFVRSSISDITQDVSRYI